MTFFLMNLFINLYVLEKGDMDSFPSFFNKGYKLFIEEND